MFLIVMAVRSQHSALSLALTSMPVAQSSSCVPLREDCLGCSGSLAFSYKFLDLLVTFCEEANESADGTASFTFSLEKKNVPDLSCKSTTVNILIVFCESF